jgi:hypothetical protein
LLDLALELGLRGATLHGALSGVGHDGAVHACSTSAISLYRSASSLTPTRKRASSLVFASIRCISST